MVYLLTTLHVLFCLFLILAILLQTGKGGGMGSAFGGGGSSTVFGPRGPGSFIAKLTGVVATLFMVTSMLLAYLSSSKATDLAEKVAALADVKHEGNEVDLQNLADQQKAPEKPAADASVSSPVDAGPVPAAAPAPAPVPAPQPIAAPAPPAPAPKPAAPKPAAPKPAAPAAAPAAAPPAAPPAPAPEKTDDDNPY